MAEHSSSRARQNRRGTRHVPRSWDRIVENWSKRIRSGVEDYSLAAESRHEQDLHRAGKGWARREESGIEVTEQSLFLNGLPAAFNEFRIVHLTDIHHGLYVPLQTVIDAVELANDLDPDLVVLTGDFVTYSRAYIEPVSAILGGLRARHGIYAVLGNHDFRVGADEVARALRRDGIEVLRNRNTVLNRRGETVHLAGIDDLGYRADLPRALRGVPERAPSILLSHNPGIIRRAAHCGVSLVLSGHTHGGQLRLPLVGNIYGSKEKRKRFVEGWDRLGPTQIYVSRGVGTIVLPWRFRCPAEIPHFHLHPADSAPLLVSRGRG
ncbi:MAG: metallophosphoesterase [Acidobacteria bacterium]|nr:metallophosphoesterase [Acidobacteriota bacterium]